MVKKETKIRVLENFHSLDFILFGKSINKINCPLTPLVEEYINIKGALLSIVVEMYKAIDHTPSIITEAITVPVLMSRARSSARLARENCKKLVSTNEGRNEIKASLKEALINNPDVDVNELVTEKIRAKSFSLAIDNLLVARALVESTDIKALNEWSGQIIEDAYKVLRDELVERAIDIINTNENVK